jgi:hypothetical protein
MWERTTVSTTSNHQFQKVYVPCGTIQDLGKPAKINELILRSYCGTDRCFATGLCCGFFEDAYENGRKHWSLITMDSSVFIEDLNCMEEQLVNGEMFRENQKNQLPSNAPVICVHAQNGADLSPEAVDKSFQMAESLFAEYHPNHQYHAYLCCPWLLYP